MGVGFRFGEGVSVMIDVQRFSKEVAEDVKGRFPTLFPEGNELNSQVVHLVATVAAIAIEKYEKENPR